MIAHESQLYQVPERIRDEAAVLPLADQRADGSGLHLDVLTVVLLQLLEVAEAWINLAERVGETQDFRDRRAGPDRHRP